ncbi:DNA topoisomerase 2, partial [Massospora cicadina]
VVEIWDPTMSKIKITINLEKNLTSMYNNGSGIPVEIHKEEKVYISKLIFGHLLTSSNYNNSKKKIAKLEKGEEFKRITLQPNLSKFQMNHLNFDIVGLLNVFLNDSKLNAPGPNREDLTKRLVFEWVSTHVNYVVDAIVKLIQEALDKNKLKCKILPGVIKGNMWIFVNCLIDNPSFDSQTKENMILKPASFGLRCNLQRSSRWGVLNLGIVNMLNALSQAKYNMAMVKALDSTKSGRILGIPKLEDANKAGT